MGLSDDHPASDSLIVQAPTGIGKTVSTLFPAFKAIGEGKCEKVFYLCAKSVTAKVARDTMRLFYEQELSLKSGLPHGKGQDVSDGGATAAMNARMRTIITGGSVLCFTPAYRRRTHWTADPFRRGGEEDIAVSF